MVFRSYGFKNIFAQRTRPQCDSGVSTKALNGRAAGSAVTAIAGHTLTVTWQRGNRDILRQAARRLKDANR